jgi:hypothetical protein
LTAWRPKRISRAAVAGQGYGNAGAKVEAVVGQLLEDEARKKPRGYAGPLLQSFQGAKQGPVRSFKNRSAG